MKRVLLFLWLSVASCIPIPSAVAALPHISTTAGPGIIQGCYDGDTCTISIPGLPSIFGDKLGVRLVGIDTPEMKGKCEQERANGEAGQSVPQQPIRISAGHYRRIRRGINTSGSWSSSLPMG